jgi:hypothetical protein
MLSLKANRPIFENSGAQEGQIVGDDSVEARTADGQLVSVDASPEYAAYVERKQIAEQAGKAGCDEKLDLCPTGTDENR